MKVSQDISFKKLNSLFILGIIGMLLTGCISPATLTYESAQTTPKSQLMITPHIEYDRSMSAFSFEDEFGLHVFNYGGKLDYGTGNRSSIGIRYTSAYPGDYSFYNRTNFIETQFKIGLGKDYTDTRKRTKFALGIPLNYRFAQSDSTDNYGVWGITPRLFMTLWQTEKGLQFTLTPSIGYLSGDIINLYLSSSINVIYTPVSHPQFSFILELGRFSGGNIEAGFGLRFNLSGKTPPFYAPTYLNEKE